MNTTTAQEGSRALQPDGYLVDYRGLAEALGLTERWVKQQTTATSLNRPDPIPHYKIGRHVRFNVPQVLNWLNRTALVGKRKQQ